jgi:hypothetical protein
VGGGQHLRGKVAGYQELLDTEYNNKSPLGRVRGSYMTKMVERGIQLILSAVNPEISELSILGVFKYWGKEDICSPDPRTSG